MGIRVIKTAAAGLAAIYTAVYLGLEPPLAAGLLAILGVEVTRMKGLKSAFARLVASAMGLFFASLIFYVFGFGIWTLSIFILVVFPLLTRLQLQGGIVTSSVVVFHLFEAKRVTTELIANELLLLVTGLGWALILNLLYMPKEEARLAALKQQTEQHFSRIFLHLSETLKLPAHLWNGEELLQAHNTIEEALRRFETYRENRLWRYERYWSTYFEMRSSQLDSIQQMLALVALVYEKVPQAELLAELLKELAIEVKSEVYEGKAERELEALELRFRSMALPATREEFEVRSALLQLCRELEHYLSIAKKWKKRKAETS